MSVNTVEIYHTFNYRGYSDTYSLEPLGNPEEFSYIIESYRLPRGWTKLMEKGRCVAIRSPKGELVKYFLARSGDMPGVKTTDGKVVFFKKAKEQPQNEDSLNG